MGKMKELWTELGELSLRTLFNEVNERVTLIFRVDDLGKSVYGTDDWSQKRAKIVYSKWGDAMYLEESNLLYLLNRQELTEIHEWLKGEKHDWVNQAAHKEGEIEV